MTLRALTSGHVVISKQDSTISGNIIQHNLRISMNERNTSLQKYLSFYSLKGPQLVVSWEVDGEIYLQRGDFFSYLLPGASGCQRLHYLASSSEMSLVGCVSLVRLFLCLCPNLTAWFSSRCLRPVTHLFNLSSLIVLSCLLITTWPLVKVRRVTWNEPKIHGICYITLCYTRWFGLVWFVWFYGISTFVGYLTPNPFLCK